jgi:multimeric flavodoxin WrbA
MNKILGIVGSPRRNGNTHILVSKILEGAKDAGGKAELLFLKDMNIRDCDGCHACWKGKPCSKKDDMNGIYPKIIESDIIVFGTPVYWYGPTAIMKAFLDRFVYFNCSRNREKINGKAAVIAIPFEEENPEAADLLVRMFEKSLDYLEMNIAGKILAPGVTLRGEIVKKAGVLKEGYELGRSLVKGSRR